MDHPSFHPCTAFDGPRRIASGPLWEVARAVKSHLAQAPQAAVLVFDDRTGRVIDLDLRGDEEEGIVPVPASQADARGRGRPRLGVVPREVTLLPRHWEWLNQQPGGASVTLRKLVEEARRHAGPTERKRLAQERAYRFMSALAGDAPGYEEALRALYAGNREAFDARTAAWPRDVRDHARALANPVFDAEPRADEAAQ